MLPSIDASFQLQQGDFNLDCEFTVAAKGVTALFGASGCGKTTLLRALAGLEQVQSGYLKVGDSLWQQEGFSLPPHQRQLGYVFQEPSLFAHLTVKQNIEYGLKRLPKHERKVSLQDAIELLGIAHLQQREPHSLSGGEKQRVAIARALAVSPRLLLMDEPLAALDQARKMEVLPYIKSLRKELDIPLIYVSHSLEEVAQLADQLIFMEKGKVTGFGKIQEMFTRLDLPLAQELDASAIIHATVSGFDKDFHLMLLQFAGGSIRVAEQALQINEEVRLRLLARDISLTLEHQVDTSILNIFPVVIDDILQTSPAQIIVRCVAGDAVILSKITRKSAMELNLKIGKQLYAQVKSVALLP